MSQLSVRSDFVAGNLAGMAGVTVGMPFDYVRVKQQTSNSSMFSVLKAEYRAGGVLQFYRGLTPPLITTGLVSAIVFAGNGHFKKVIADSKGHDDNTRLSFFELMLAGGGGGLAALPVIIPVQRLKILQQTSAEGRRSKITSVISKLIKTEGVRGLFKGGTAVGVLEVCGRGSYLAVYATMLRAFNVSADTTPKPERGGAAQSAGFDLPYRLASGGLAGLAGWLSIYPLDVIKTRYMSQAPGEKTYSGLVDCAVRTVREGGVRILFRGLSVTLIRAMPVAMVTLPSYEFFQRFLSKYLDPQ